MIGLPKGLSPRLAPAAALCLVLGPAAWAAPADSAPGEAGGGVRLERARAEILFAEGLVAWEDGRLARARRLFVDAADGDPGVAAYARLAGIALYREARPVVAEQYLRRALRADADDSAARYALGLVLIDLGRHDEAHAALVRAGQEAPRSGPALRAWFHAGVAALRAGADEEGLALMRRVVDLAGATRAAGGLEVPPAGIVADARWYLERANRPAARWSWGLEAGTTVEWDDDPAILGDDLRGAVDTAARREGDDGDRRLVAGVRSAWSRLSERSPWASGIVVEALASRHEDLRDLDQLAPRASVQIARGRDPSGRLPGPLGPLAVSEGFSRATLILQADASYAWLDGGSFARRSAAAAGFGLHPAAWSRVRIEAIARDDRYFGPYAARSGPSGTARLAHDLLLNAPSGSLTVGRSWSVTDADGSPVDRDGDGTDEAFDAGAFDRDGEGWFAGLSLAIGRSGGLRVDWSRRESDYDTPFPGTALLPRKDRRDLRTDRAATLTVSVVGGWSVSARYARIENDSSVPGLSYDRSITSLAGVWRYR